MTNIERIRNMDAAQLVEMFKEIRKEKLFDYIDWIRYLQSEDSQYIYKGEPAMLYLSGRVYKCLVVGRTDFDGHPYLRVLWNGEVVAVSADRVEIISSGKPSE